jgi:hypothetical protein
MLSIWARRRSLILAVSASALEQHITSADNDFVDTNCIQQFDVMAGYQVDSMIAGVEGRIAVAGQVRRDHPTAAFRKVHELREPQIPVVTEAVEEHHRLASAAVVVGDIHSVRNG